MVDGISCFSEDLDTARDRFLTACDRIGLRVLSYPAKGERPDGGMLSCDVTRLGSPEAVRVAVLCSAAGGPAGLLGCGGALGILTEGGLKDIPRDVALVLVHAANPGGPIWPYFPEEESGMPDQPGPEWSDSILSGAEARFADFQAKLGLDWGRLAEKPLISMALPAWDGDTLRAIAAEWFDGAQQVCVIDPRTGPGPFAQHEIVPCDAEHSAGRDRAERWFTLNVVEESKAVGAGNAPCGGGLGGLLPKAQVTNVILEIGTYSFAGLLGGEARGRRDAISSFPAAPDWQLAAWLALRDTLRTAYRGLLSVS